MILPICYSESFYKMDLPPAIKENLLSGGDESKKLEHHIGCYPWRKNLFEYYGIRYRSKNSKTEYFDYEEAANKKNGFSDKKYYIFPYHEILDGSTEKIGKIIYDKLKNEYNDFYNTANTLVVYTMDGFLNEEQAGQCIVNFYRNIVARMRQEECFCGDRVGVLVQETSIQESEKDAKDKQDLPYSVGKMIHIGLNQATYLAAEEKIKTRDALKVPEFLEKQNKSLEEPLQIREDQKEAEIRFVKNHIRNRGMLIYPNTPVYVTRMKNKIQTDLLDISKIKKECICCNTNAFCLYHVMLRNLRYTNEIVVDITDNCLQTLFWLGVAHGSDVYAITVLHEKTEQDRKESDENGKQESRNVFDVAGLWAAIYHTRDTEGFYRQLALAQIGIERRSKLMVVNSDFYKKSIQEYLFSFEADSSKNKPEKLLEEKKQEERNAMESYYRKHFWNPMLGYNRLSIYLSQRNSTDEKDHEPRINIAKWDLDAISALSHYLSKRTVIGEYHIKSLTEGEIDPEAEKVNFICVGTFVQPMNKTLTEDIHKKIGSKFYNFKGVSNIVYQREEHLTKKCIEGIEKLYKGFNRLDGGKDILFTQHPRTRCTNCQREEYMPSERKIFRSMGEIESSAYCLSQMQKHIEIAQLVLWRENQKTSHGRSYFRVALNGSSGPATFGLSTLFVDQEQKQEYFGEMKEEENHLLCKLQEIVREKFMELFLDRLQKEFDTIKLSGKKSNSSIPDDQQEKYFNLVKHAVSYYLSTVLYRYFLPFLSERDIQRICNGMYIFIHSMKAANTSPFSLRYFSKGCDDAVSDEDIIKIVSLIPNLLSSSLSGFRGLEAFYEVAVKHGDNVGETPKKDTRDVLGIRMLTPDNPVVNCFFISDTNDK